MRQSLKEFVVDRWERIVYFWVPKNISDEDTRERRILFALRVFKRALRSNITLFILLLLSLLFVGRTMSWWYGGGSSGDSHALISAPELNLWLHNTHEIDAGLISPPYKSIDEYQHDAHICDNSPALIHLMNYTNNTVPSLAHVQSVYYYHERQKRFISIAALALTMLNSYKGDSDVLCTYMFSNWTELVQPVPCMCIMNKPHSQDSSTFATAAFSPSISLQSNSTVRARVRNIMGILSPMEVNTAPDQNPNTFVRTLPKMIQASFDHISPHSISTASASNNVQQQQQSVDMRTNRILKYTSVLPSHAALTLVNVAEINLWINMCSALQLNFVNAPQ